MQVYMCSVRCFSDDKPTVKDGPLSSYSSLHHSTTSPPLIKMAKPPNASIGSRKRKTGTRRITTAASPTITASASRPKHHSAKRPPRFNDLSNKNDSAKDAATTAVCEISIDVSSSGLLWVTVSSRTMRRRASCQHAMRSWRDGRRTCTRSRSVVCVSSIPRASRLALTSRTQSSH